MSRPAFDRAIGGIRSGKYGGIAVARLSRFGRKTSGILELIYELEELGSAVVVLDPPIDTSTAAGRAMLTVFSAFVTMEAEQAVEQAQQVAAKKLAEGKGMGGFAALGYEYETLGTDSNGKNLRGWLVPSADAKHVEAAFELFVAAGGTPGKVADFLNGRGLHTGRGNPWGIESARRLLMNEVYIGVRKYGDHRIESAHKNIVPLPLWRKAVKKLGWTYTTSEGFKRIGGPVTRTRGDGHLLGEGLVRCGLCGKALVKGSANGTYGTLRCLGRGSGHPSIGYDRAADYIVSQAVDHVGLVQEELHGGGNAEEVTAAVARLETARADLVDVEALRGSVTPAAFALALSDAQMAVEVAEDALAVVDRSESFTVPWFTTPGGHRQHFESLSIPEQRCWLREVIDAVTLLTGVKGKPGERLAIEWKTEPGPRGLAL